MKKTIKTAAFILLLIFCGIMGGCSQGEQSAEAESSLISFVDDDGNLISLDKPAERIISLYSAHTENLYYLGAQDKLIGGYKTCVYPPEAAFLPMYDYNGDPEEVIAAEPDVLLIRPFVRRKAPEYIEIIEKAGIKVVSLYPDAFDEFDDYINKLAMLTGTEEKAAEKLEKFHNDINEITELTKAAEKNTVFFESTETNIRTVTPDSMAGLAIEFAGGENIAKDAEPIEEGSSIAAFGEEKVLENADSIDVYISQRGSMNSGGNLISIGERAGYSVIKAVKDNRVFLINEKIVSSPTFRYVKGVREIARFLYPDIMDSLEDVNLEETATRRSMANIFVKALHTPVYLPTSSSYYKTEQKGHTFGLFEDLKWDDADFDFIETAVYTGYMPWDKEDDKEYFYPEKSVTRDELAQAIFLIGDFSDNGNNIEIADLSESEHQRIVKILVNNGVLELNNGMFEPEREVTNEEIINAIKKANSEA